MSRNERKSVKNFYTDDKLNKGYQESDEAVDIGKQVVQNDALARKYESLLPPVEVISEYEAFSPGVLNKIIKMAQLEQEQKFAMDKVTLAMNAKSQKLSIIFGSMLVAIICATTIKLAELDTKISLIFAFIAFTAIFGVSLLSFLRKRAYNNDRSRNYNAKYENKAGDQHQKHHFSSKARNNSHKRRKI